MGGKKFKKKFPFSLKGKNSDVPNVFFLLLTRGKQKEKGNGPRPTLGWGREKKRRGHDSPIRQNEEKIESKEE